MSITAIVPVWNGRDLLERLLRTVAAQTLPANELLAIDNGSTDGAPDAARGYGARVISMGRNTGFAVAVNRGLREASSDWIAVLNSDVELAPDYFERLHAANAWFANGKLLSAADPSRIDGAYDLVSRGAAAWRAGSGQPDGPAFDEPREIASAPWTAALFRASLFEKVGLLEETFESYLEDVDFGLRCAALGISGRYVPEAIAYHRGSSAYGRWHPETVRLISRNQVFLAARYPEFPLWPVLVAQLLWGAVALRHGAGMAWLSGKWQALKARRGHQAGPRTIRPELLEQLHQNEREIRRLQLLVRPDLYWRLYFLLTAGEAK
jgi:GT2 family glycosyltransferase